MIEFQIVDAFTTIYPVPEVLDKLMEDAGDVDDDADGGNNNALSNIYTYPIQSQFSVHPEGATIVKLFGRTTDDQSIIVNVKGFQTFFYLCFRRLLSSRMEAEKIVNQLKQKVTNRRYLKHLVEWKLEEKQPYEMFVGEDRFSFIKLSFINQYALKAYERAAQSISEVNQFYVGESGVDEILKFFHGKNIRPASWVTVSQYEIVSSHRRSGYCQLEIDCRLEFLNPPLVDKVHNNNFKVMIYDLECQSVLGELGEFPVARKDFLKLARELIDLKLTHRTHPLITNEATFTKTVERCLQLVFEPHFYPSQIQQLVTRQNLKPTEALIDQVVDLIIQLQHTCHLVTTAMVATTATVTATVTKCDCTDTLTVILNDTFPPLIDGGSYHHFARELWLSIENLIKAKYVVSPTNLEELERNLAGKIKKMIQVAFEDYYDRFGFTPLYLKKNGRGGEGRPPASKELIAYVPEIIGLINQTTAVATTATGGGASTSIDYTTKLDNLSSFLSEKLVYVKPLGDAIIQIGFTFQRLGTTDPYLKGIYTVDTCTSFHNDDLIKDENEGKGQDNAAEAAIQKQKLTDKANVIIRSFTTEKEMILAFAQLVNQEDPDMIGGYNTFGFDDQYLATRSEELGIRQQVLSKLTRLRRDLSEMMEPAGSEKGKRKMETHYLEMKGRVPFDIYRIIPTIHNLPEYKLNYVCKHFFKKEKNDVPPTQIPILQRGNADDRALIARYCIIDCVLCNRLLQTLSIIPNLIAMANVSIVPIRYLLFRGQTIKGYSLIAKKCLERGKILRTVSREEREACMNEDKYEGAIVLDPLIDIYDRPISVADFNSLYPCSMISENISNDTLVVDPKYDHLEGVDYNVIEYDEFAFVNAKNKRTGLLLEKKEKVKKEEGRVCRFAANVLGILPEIEKELIDNRNYAKKKMKEALAAGDESLADAWDSQQLAYKITCNSIYGITGATVSPIYNKDVAASITATGRKMIKFSKNYVEDSYVNVPISLTKAKLTNVKPSNGTTNVIVKKATCVYGDTDSIFIKFDIFEASSGLELIEMDAVFASMEICERVANEITMQLKAPQKLAFEKTIYPFLLINKKMYKGNYYEEINSHHYKEKVMGFMTKKRDSSPIAGKVVDGLTHLLFTSTVTQKSIQAYLEKEFALILGGTLPIEMFIRTKSWKGHYANPDGIPQHVLAIRQAIRDPGNQFQVNDRIPFVHIVNPTAQLQGDKIETVEFVKSHPHLKIDYYYYIEKQLIKPLLKLLLPNRQLGITEKWLMGILNNLHEGATHSCRIGGQWSSQPKKKEEDRRHHYNSLYDDNNNSDDDYSDD